MLSPSTTDLVQNTVKMARSLLTLAGGIFLSIFLSLTNGQCANNVAIYASPLSRAQTLNR